MAENPLCTCQPGVVCIECFRASRNHRRAHLLPDMPSLRPLPVLFPVTRTLSARAIEHRARMLAYLAADRRHGVTAPR